MACALDEASSAGAPSLVRRDSAGIMIVENAAPAWPGGEGWRIDSVPELVIGAAPLLDAPDDPVEPAAARVPLERVQAVRVLSDGRIVVADAGPAELMIFDPAGGLVSRFGGRGGGPGEFTGIVDVHVCGGDSIVVVGRFDLFVFDDRGGFARQASYRSGGERRSLAAVSMSCGRVLTRSRASAPPLGSWGRTEDVFAWLDPLSQAVDTVTQAGLLEGWTRLLYGAVRPFVIPWGTSSRTHAVDRDRLVLGYGRVPELRRYAATGLLESVIRWAPEPRPITRTDRGHYADVRSEWLAGMPDHPETRFLFPALDEYPGLPAEKPLFDRILVDDEGGVWVRAFPEASFGLFDVRLRERTWSRRTWTVFDSTGVWLGELTLPDRFELHAVARGRLFGVAWDSLDVQTVRVLRIRERSGSSEG